MSSPKNIVRRHLTAEGKRELVAELLKMDAEKSDRQVAALARVDHKTVGVVRTEEEGRGEIPHVAKRTDTKGRRQPGRKTVGKHASKPKPDATAPTTVPAKKIKYKRGHSPLEVASRVSTEQPLYDQDLDDFVEHRAQLTTDERKALIEKLQSLACEHEDRARGYKGIATKLVDEPQASAAAVDEVAA